MVFKTLTNFRKEIKIEFRCKLFDRVISCEWQRWIVNIQRNEVTSTSTNYIFQICLHTCFRSMRNSRKERFLNEWWSSKNIYPTGLSWIVSISPIDYSKILGLWWESPSWGSLYAQQIQTTGKWFLQARILRQSHHAPEQLRTIFLREAK